MINLFKKSNNFTLGSYRIDKDLFKKYVEGCLEEGIKDIFENFKSEYVFPNNLRRYKTVFNCLVNWLQGIPSYLSIEFTYFGIRNVFKAIEQGRSNFEELSEDNQSIMYERYWPMIAESLVEIFEAKYGKHKSLDLSKQP